MTDAAITKARERFTRDTAEHQMTVRHDDGLYRHLRFSAPQTYTYGFDLITWPGFLCICGDMQTYVFSRMDDMFTFFGDGESINPDYWGEKLQAPRGQRAVEVFSEARYRQSVEQWLAEQLTELDDRLDPGVAAHLRSTVRARPLHEPPLDEREAIERLQGFDCEGRRIYEPYEWGLTEFDPHFLWCCWAIAWGIRQYRESKVTQ